MEGLTKSEEQEYQATRKISWDLSKEIGELRKILSEKEIEFSKACKKKWAFEEKVVGIKVIPAKTPSQKTQKIAKKQRSMEELLDASNRGELSKEDLLRELKNLI